MEPLTPMLKYAGGTIRYPYNPKTIHYHLYSLLTVNTARSHQAAHRNPWNRSVWLTETLEVEYLLSFSCIWSKTLSMILSVEVRDLLLGPSQRINHTCHRAAHRAAHGAPLSWTATVKAWPATCQAVWHYNYVVKLGVFRHCRLRRVSCELVVELYRPLNTS